MLVPVQTRTTLSPMEKSNGRKRIFTLLEESRWRETFSPTWGISVRRWNPKKMRVLELGCGAGRVTRALAEVFGSVDGVDVSPEMIQRARAALGDVPTARVHLIDGMSVQPVKGNKFDFAYSCCVFHHISSYEVIRDLVKDIGDTLSAGDLFKFEVQGCAAVNSGAGETWLGMPFSEQLAGEGRGLRVRITLSLGRRRRAVLGCGSSKIKEPG